MLNSVIPRQYVAPLTGVGGLASFAAMTGIAAASPDYRFGLRNAETGLVPFFGDVRVWLVGAAVVLRRWGPRVLRNGSTFLGGTALLSLFATESIRVAQTGYLFGLDLARLQSAQEIPLLGPVLASIGTHFFNVQQQAAAGALAAPGL